MYCKASKLENRLRVHGGDEQWTRSRTALLVSHPGEPRLVAAEWINQTARQQQCVGRRLGNMRCKALNMNVIENENGVMAVSLSHVEGREPSVQSRLIAVVPTELVSWHPYCQERLCSSVICPSKLKRRLQSTKVQTNPDTYPTKLDPKTQMQH